MQSKTLSKHALSLIVASLLSQTASSAQYTVRVEKQQTKRIERPGAHEARTPVSEQPNLAASPHASLAGNLRSDQFKLEAPAQLQPKRNSNEVRLAGQLRSNQIDADAQLQLMRQTVAGSGRSDASAEQAPKLGTSTNKDSTGGVQRKSSVDYTAIEAEYAKMAAQPAETTLNGGLSVPVISPKPHIEGHLDPMLGKVPIIIDDKGNTHNRPDLKAEVCECGTEIPSSQCLQRRAGVGLYANQSTNQGAPHSAPVTLSTPAAMGRR